MNIPGYIYDRYNQRYAVEVEEDSELSFYIKLKDGETYIGQMLVSFLPDDVMILEDLFIRSDLDAPEKWTPGRKTGRMAAGILSRLVSAGGRQGKRRPESVRNYRNRGLGSELIKILLDLAAERKGKVIFGSLIREDIAINPQLLEWYMHRGFTVSGPFKNCIPDAVTYIRFNVPQAE
jgi:GNAT superfamily N-acetyltransferase